MEEKMHKLWKANGGLEDMMESVDLNKQGEQTMENL